MASRREHFKPTKWSYLRGKHFNTTDYTYSTNSMRLKDEAVPRKFDLPEHLCGKLVGKRFSPKQRMAFEIDEAEQPSCSSNLKKVRSVVKLQQVKIKSLQQKVRRKQNAIKSLKDKLSKGNRNSDEAKIIVVLTLHFYSTKAYDYVRSIICLPHLRSILRWKSSVNCEPGYFQDVFLQSQKMIENDNCAAGKCLNTTKR